VIDSALVVAIYLMLQLLLNSGILSMKKILFLILLLSLPMSNVSADEGKKLYSPAIELYEKVKSNTIQFYNNLIGEEHLNLGFQSMEQPLTKGFDFVCYNSCKERNDDGFCRKQCSLQ
jgi:hypothetical protein